MFNSKEAGGSDFLVAKATAMVAMQIFKVSYKIMYVRNYRSDIIALTMVEIFIPSCQ